MDHTHIYLMQILFIGGITYGSQSLNLANKHKWAISVARYVLYVLIVQATSRTCEILYDIVINKRVWDIKYIKKMKRHHITISVIVISFLLLNDEQIISEDFTLIFIALLIVTHTEVEKYTSITNGRHLTYGAGMACSYFEGYLAHVIPPDGANYVGLEENIRAFEEREGVVFPVKKFFIIIPKSLYSPPDLKQFNKPHRGSKLEALNSLPQIEKDVAGQKKRIYKNPAYKIYRSGARPVCLTAACAGLLNTLYNVMKNRHLYEELADIDRDDIMADYLTTLRKTIDNSPECRDMCELIHFDDTDKKLNLADVLLDRIRELEPNFEELIVPRR